MNRDVCEHFNPVDLPCDKCRSEALRLADALEISSNHGIRREAAAELRRLHDDNENALKHFAEVVDAYKQMAAQRDALLEALRGVMSVMPTLPKDARHIVDMEDRYKEALVAARAAIKKAEGA